MTGVRSTGPEHGLILYGAPFGSPPFVTSYLASKNQSHDRILADIGRLSDARLAFQLQRVTASVCRFTENTYGIHIYVIVACGIATEDTSLVQF